MVDAYPAKDIADCLYDVTVLDTMEMVSKGICISAGPFQTREEVSTGAAGGALVCAGPSRRQDVPGGLCTSSADT